MKKYFIFAAVAAVGLFASCSSDDFTSGQNPVNPTDAPQTIRLNLSSPGAMTTRGTGTVGGVGTSTNVWRGQKINVFMFTKDDTHATTLNLTNIGTAAAPQYLYKNTTMITPGSAENLIDGMGVTANVASGQAMIEDGTINYYPSIGNFDFFGYHADDALTGALDDTDNAKWTVPFTITGTQDLMSTKAALTSDQKTMMGTSLDYYSAKSARKGVDPTLTFKHLLTRLQFSVKAGNDKAAGYTPGADIVTDVDAASYAILDAAAQAQCEIKDYTPKAGDEGKLTDTEYGDGSDVDASWRTTPGDHAWTGADPLPKAAFDNLTTTEQGKFVVANYIRTQPATTGTLVAANAVKVKSIQVLSENTKGNLAVAWTADLTDDAKIAWDANQPDEADRWFTLMERPVLYDRNANETIERADIEAYKDMTDGEYSALGTDEKAVVDAAINEANQAQITGAIYAKLSTTGKNKFTIVANTENEQLVALTATAPTVDGTEAPGSATRYPQTRVGESIILSPGAYTANSDPTKPAAGSAQSLKMKVVVTQNVPTDWHDATNTTEKEQSYDLVINAPAGGFLQNTSYNVILTVYSLERIDVVAVITPWEEGGNISVGEDE